MGGCIMPDWLTIALRTLLTIVILFVLTKLLGKRQVSQLSFFEYITGITIGSIAAYVSTDMDERWFLGIVSLIVWAAVSLVLEIMPLKSKVARDIIDGKSRIIIKDGKILEENLKKERLTIDELMEQLRKKDVFQAADVEFAVMDPSGNMNILLAKENQPITPKHLGIKVAPEKEPQVVIMDGKVMFESLATMGLNQDWLDTELEITGVALENVFLGQVDAYGQLYVDLFDDQIQVPKPQKKAALLATLKKCEADLEMFSLSTKETKAKEMYEECAKELERVIKDVKPLLIQ